MLTDERQQQILDYLSKKKSVSVKKLSQILFVSQATIRRDLTVMEKQGLLKRSHGGAIFFDNINSESSISVREQEHIKEKKIIAQIALDFIRENQTIFMDSSSTVGNIIPYLNKFKFLTVITTGLKNALILSQFTNAKIYMANGIVNNQSNSIVGSDTTEYLNRFNADLCFISCSGIDLKCGITDASLEQSNIKKCMVKNSKTKVLLCDNHKFDHIFLCKSFDFSDFDYILTDKLPPQNYIEQLKSTNCEFIGKLPINNT